MFLADYNAESETFVVQDFQIDATYDEWTDGEAGFSFTGIGDDGDIIDLKAAALYGEELSGSQVQQLGTTTNCTFGF